VRPRAWDVDGAPDPANGALDETGR
jgi:hypothetical protein